MKKNISELIILLFLFVSCIHHNGENVAEQPQNILIPDSLFEPTGDAMLDSLLQLAAVAPQDTDLVFLYKRIANRYELNDYEKAKEYYLKIGDLSDRLNYNIGRLTHSSGIAFILGLEGLTDSALVIYNNAIEFAKREKDEWATAILLTNAGTAYIGKDWYETALNCYMEAIVYLENEYKNNPKDRTLINNLQVVYSQMSQLYGIINNTEKSIEYGEKVVMLETDFNKEFAYYTLAMAYSNVNQDDKAKTQLEEALRLCEENNNTYLKGLIYVKLGKYAMYDFDFKTAEKYLLQALEINRELARDSYCGSYIALSKMELLRGNNIQSEKYIKEALQLATEYEYTGLKKDCYKILSELAVAQGKFREHIQYETEWNLIDKEISKETALRAAEEMSAKYETEKKQLEIERQQSVIARQNMQRWLFVGGIAVCVVFLALLWNMVRLRNRRNHALTEMNATKDKFFNIISHDLKNPAISQRDALQTLISNAHLWDVNRLTNYYHELLKSAEGEVELIYNLLGWAQLQTGRITYTPSTFNLAHRLRSDISLIRNMSEKKGVTLAVTIPEDADVTGDGNMISTVVRNLLSNAVKFTPSGGQVTLEVSPRHEDKYTVTITDTGIGMNNEQLEMLRTPSLQNAHSRKGTAGEQGSGLGLIVCHELLEKHGSKLYIDSEEGKGSRFYFELRIEN